MQSLYSKLPNSISYNYVIIHNTSGKDWSCSWITILIRIITKIELNRNIIKFTVSTSWQILFQFNAASIFLIMMSLFFTQYSWTCIYCTSVYMYKNHLFGVVLIKRKHCIYSHLQNLENKIIIVILQRKQCTYRPVQLFPPNFSN